MNKIRIGVLGCADIAKRLVIPNILDCGRFELMAVASRTVEKANEYAKQFNCEAIVGYQNLLNRTDIDAVYIPLPTGMHYEWITKALQANKHVFSEKSFACDYQEASFMIDLAREKKLVVLENFMFPHHSQMDFVKTKLAERAIGDLRLLRASFGFPPFKIDSNIRYNKALGGGALLDAGAYTLMAAQLFLGYEQKVTSAIMNKWSNEVDFQGAIMLENENHIISQLAFGFDNFYQNNIELWGTKGKLVIERAFTAPPEFSPKVVIETQGKKEEFMLPPDNHFLKILTVFANTLENENFQPFYKQLLNQAFLITQCKKISN